MPGRGVVPLRRAGDVRQRGVVLSAGIELRAIHDDQAFTYVDHRSGGQSLERELARGAVVGERVVRPLHERTLARHRRHAVGREHARARDLRRGVAHSAGRAVGQPIEQRHVERVESARVPHVEAEIAVLRRIHRRRAGFVDREFRRAGRDRRQHEFADEARAVDRAAFSRDELGHRITVVQEAHLQRVVDPIDVERRGRRRRDDLHTVRAPFPGWCRKGTRHRVVRRLDVVERKGEAQRSAWDAVHVDHEDDIEQNRGQGRVVDLEIPMRERAEREERDRPGQRERRRDGRSEVVAALRRAHRLAPPDDRGRAAVRDDGIGRLNSGEVVRRVMPSSGNGGVRDVGRRRAPGVRGTNGGEQEAGAPPAA